MENNPLAMETLILCYIESKNMLKTKQLDQNSFDKVIIESCKEFQNYSDEEIILTWRNLLRQYLQIKNNNLETESWRYYKIMNSCYETSDFHQCGQSKFSEEMVWFLIECLLKRRVLKRSDKSDRMTEVFHEFLEEGYVNLNRHDIEAKWRYLNDRYSKIKHNKNACQKMPYFAAIDAFRNGRKYVKMVFTKSLTEQLIRKFSQRKILCNFHGYDSQQVVNEIRNEFLNLDPNVGFDFTCEEIIDKWTKLTNIYDFLKKKHKSESKWVYFQAMKEHFEENTIEKEIPWGSSRIIKNTLRKRSKSLDRPANSKKSKVTVEDQFDDRSMSPPSIKEVKPKSSCHNETFIRNIETKEMSCTVDQQLNNMSLIDMTNLKKSLTSCSKQKQHESSSSLGSKVHIINIHESSIDKTSGNITINLPSITKKFSDNEFLPLKKRLRLNDEQASISKEITDGFRGFSATEQNRAASFLGGSDFECLCEEDMSEIITRISEGTSLNTNTVGVNYNAKENDNCCKFQRYYEDFSSQCVLPKRELDAVRSYPTSDTSQPPVFLIVLRVDGNSPQTKDDSDSVPCEDLKEDDENKNGCNSKSDVIGKNLRHTFGENQENSSLMGTTELFKTSTVDISVTEAHTHNHEQTCDEVNKEKSFENVRSSNSNENCTSFQNTENLKPIPEYTTNPNNINEYHLKLKSASNSYRELKNVSPPIRTSRCELTQESSTEKHNANIKKEQRSIRLPVTCGGKLKEIFISPKELSKIVNMKPNPRKCTSTQIMMDSKTHVLKNNNDKKGNMSSEIGSSTTATSERNKEHLVSPSGDFDGHRSVSESVDDELLADVIEDFQAQSILELREIKKFVRENNSLQRETNVILRKMLEKL